MKLVASPNMPEKAADLIEQIAARVRDGKIKHYALVALDPDVVGGIALAHFKHETTLNEDLLFYAGFGILKGVMTDDLCTEADD